MLRNKKVMAIMLAFVMVFTMLAPAFAATDNYAVSVPRVTDDKSGQSLGTIVVKEDEDSDGFFKNDNIITVRLPSGVEFDNITDNQKGIKVNELMSEGNNVSDFVYTEAPGVDLKVLVVTDSYYTIQVVGDSPQDEEYRMWFFFGDRGNLNSTVDIDSGVSGDIRVEIDAEGTPITSSFVTVARVVTGNTITTVDDVKTIALDTEGAIGTIEIRENAPGVLGKSTERTATQIKLKLPNDFEWGDITNDNIVAVGVEASLGEVDEDELFIKIDKPNDGVQPGFITLINAKVYVPDDAREGEFEINVSGNDVTRENIVLGKVGDYGFKVEVKGDLETVIGGQQEQEVNEIVIDDVVKGSWVTDRTVTLKLPSWAEWNKESVNINQSFGPLKVTKVDEQDLRLTVEGKSGKAELKDLEVDLDANAPAGDLVVEIAGSAGVSEELIIAEVVTPFTVTAENPQFSIGVQGQQLGDITITESVDGAIEKDRWIVFRAPNGMYFKDTPTVKVEAGDIKIDKEDSVDSYFAFKVTGESARDAAVIKVTDIYLDVDRTVPTGDITFRVNMTDGGDYDFNDATYRDNHDEVTRVVIGTVVTPAPGAGTAVFTIGSTIYTVDGVANVVEAAPYIKEGRTFIPVRAAAEATGAVVEYDEATRTVTATKDGKEVKMVIGQVGASGVAPEIVNDRTFVPIRDMEALGLILGYDPVTKQVVVK